MARGRQKPPFEQFVEQDLFQLSDQRCAEITLRWRRYDLLKPVNGLRSGRRRRTPPTGSETAKIGSSSAAISPRSAARRLRVAGRGGRRRSRAYSPPSAPSAAGFTRQVAPDRSPVRDGQPTAAPDAQGVDLGRWMGRVSATR